MHQISHPGEVGQVLVLGPVLLSRAAYKIEDLGDLLQVTLAWQEGCVEDELAHDAAHAPHVNGC